MTTMASIKIRNELSNIVKCSSKCEIGGILLDWGDIVGIDDLRDTGMAAVYDEARASIITENKLSLRELSYVAYQSTSTSI